MLSFIFGSLSNQILDLILDLVFESFGLHFGISNGISWDGLVASFFYLAELGYLGWAVVGPSWILAWLHCSGTSYLQVECKSNTGAVNANTNTVQVKYCSNIGQAQL